MPEIQLLTYHWSTNPGGLLFARSVMGAVKGGFSSFRTRALDYIHPRRRLYQAGKILKPEPSMPLFNARRHLTFRRFIHQELDLDRRLSPFASREAVLRYLHRPSIAAVIVGMDVWNISADWFLEPFPSAYWLPGELNGLKVAYAVSAHRSSLAGLEVHKEEIRALLDDFALIGVRDHFTQELLRHVGVRSDLPVSRVMDPTFLLPLEPIDRGALREQHGLDSSPVLGLLTYGRSTFCKSIAEVFRAAGYQIVAPSMYSPYADRNLGHCMNPYQWANFFQAMDFCVTDRYHGAIFCLKSRTPFLAIEPRPLESPLHSKHRSLLLDFELLDCYLDPHVEKVGGGDIESRLETIQSRWQGWLPHIEAGIASAQRGHKEFLSKMNSLLTA